MKQKRIYAFLIDLLVIAVPSTLLMVLSVFMLRQDFLPALYGSLALAALLLLLKDLPFGRSPGKYFLGLEISNGASALRRVWRNMTLIALPIEALAVLIYKKRLGDVLFKTDVVADETSSFNKFTELLAGVFIVLLLVFLQLRNLAGYYIRQRQEYMVAEAFIYGNQAIRQKTGEVVKLSKVPDFNFRKRNGQTELTIELKVYGQKENADLAINLIKKDGGQWVVNDYEIIEKE
ncbi:hypothetical protein [Emticicia sp. TH156]|uniref:hypothetical protein n=1 Tax=Emticicia sp. TH156 TaxID=2067454 RepID=UPI000C78EAE2|nr:hypothetical protein [Emticicia sp. TH156]PLK44300.1 hypothetical protein C0V77_10935 [Emticicia sp. TH156]